MQDVPEYVRRKGLEFRCYLDPRRAACVDAEHCVRLNWEAYFFADLESKQRFLGDATRYCGLLTDPITRRRFRPSAQSPQAEFRDVRYYFESELSRARFESDPEMYRLPHWSM